MKYMYLVMILCVGAYNALSDDIDPGDKSFDQWGTLERDYYRNITNNGVDAEIDMRKNQTINELNGSEPPSQPPNQNSINIVDTSDKSVWIISRKFDTAVFIVVRSIRRLIWLLFPLFLLLCCTSKQYPQRQQQPIHQQQQPVYQQQQPVYQQQPPYGTNNL